jgi:hypothetical protein
MKKPVLVVLCLLCSILPVTADPASPDLRGTVLWQLQSDKDFRGAVLHGVAGVDGKDSYIATAARLYRVRDGRAKIIAERPDKDSRLSLAPGGGTYAWLTQKASLNGLFSVEVSGVSGEHRSELVLKEFPHGFGSLYLGFQGRLIATSSPLDDWQGLAGRFRITFWNRGGEMLESVVLEGRQSGVLDPSGEALLFLGEKEARAFSASGKELWRLKGHFRKAALARGGRIAVLNPGAQGTLDQVLVFRGEGEPSALKVPTPVHGLAITPDGSTAAVIGDGGRYFPLDVRKAELREGRRLPIRGTFYIFNAEFVDGRTLAFGALERVGESHHVRWPRGAIVIADLKGSRVFQRVFPVRQATAFYPALSTVFGSRHVLAFTQEEVILIKLRAGR